MISIPGSCSSPGYGFKNLYLFFVISIPGSCSSPPRSTGTDPARSLPPAGTLPHTGIQTGVQGQSHEHLKYTYRLRGQSHEHLKRWIGVVKTFDGAENVFSQSLTICLTAEIRVFINAVRYNTYLPQQVFQTFTSKPPGPDKLKDL